MDTRSYTDFSITFATYITKYTGIWVPRNPAEELQRKISMTYTAFVLLYGIYVNAVDIYYSWGDATHCTFVILNTTCISMTTVKMIILNSKRAGFIDALFYAQRHFWHENYNSKERLIFSISVKYCIGYVIFAAASLQIALSGYVITPLIENLERNKSNRVLPVNMWVDLPLYETPYFELMFTFQANTSASMRIIFLFHAIGSLGQLFMLTYTSHFMMEESTNIITAMYLGSWSTLPMNEVGRSFRSAMKFVMIRSLKPCYLTAAGFFPLTLETFTSLLSSTFSYFTLMRQSFMRSDG
ncbi:uncharacterized protein LOC117603758 [Osmia lignaria lignaria]|uniref:uncharacterized protein LOC117603758 n=1 Tax=Osmia lignaria lignaria TaxID=1437193 RepID=UPI00402B894D